MLSLPLFGLIRTVGVFVAIVAMTSCAVAAPRPETVTTGLDSPWGFTFLRLATLGPDGRLWESEHGPQGGDEINIPLAGRNYGGRQCLPRGGPALSTRYCPGRRPVTLKNTELKAAAEP